MASKGTSSGPASGECPDWIWDHNDCPVATSPEQVHLALTHDPREIVITWSTKNESDSFVFYREENSNQTYSSSGNVTYFSEHNEKGLHWIHRVHVKSLKTATRYIYYVSSNGDASQEFSFVTLNDPQDPNWEPYYVILGDMGRFGGSPCLSYLKKETHKKNITAIFHIGDFAYDLDTDSGRNGDAFMARLQEVAAYVPYMTCPGNHEIEDDLFANYRNRFSMPGYEENDGYNMWWSVNIKNIHWILYSTEVYYTSRTEDIDAQYEWLKNDLAEANQHRDGQPWIIAMAHRPMYCSNTDRDCANSAVKAGLETLFFQAGVDLIIEGHEHSYERTWPVYDYFVTQYNYIDPQAPIHLITGSAGCNEADGTCMNPILKMGGAWSAFYTWQLGLNGYGHLYAPNSTHLYWEQITVDTDSVQDSIWVVQNHHGTRELGAFQRS